MLLFLLLVATVFIARAEIVNVVEIDGCSDLYANTYYVLTTSIIDSSSGTCMNVLGENVTLDGQGYTIDGIDDWNSVGLYTAFSNTTVKNSIFTDWGGVWFDIGANNGKIENVIVNSAGWGIYIEESDFFTLNKVTANDNDGSGIWLTYSDSSTIYNVTANNNLNEGIYIDHSHNITLERITANDNSGGNGGVAFDESDFCTIDNVTASYNELGIWNGGNNNTIRNVIANNNWEGGIVVGYDNHYTTIQNVIVNNNTDYGIWLSASSHNIMESVTAKYNGAYGGIHLFYPGSNDNIIRNSIVEDNVYDFYLNHGSDITVLNTTYDTTYFGDAASSLTRQWYLDVNIKDQQGNPLESANVTVEDVFGTQIFSEFTASNGTIPRKSITQYKENSVGKTFYAPYRISATKPGYQNTSDSIPLSGNEVVTLSLHVITPEKAIESLIQDVVTMNLGQGIENSFDAKLDAALGSLEALNADQRNDSINKLYAFINAVEAQRGNKITNEQADYLIAEVQRIIDLIEG